MRPPAAASSIRIASPQARVARLARDRAGSGRAGVAQGERVLDGGGGVHARSLDGPQPLRRSPRARPRAAARRSSLNAAAKPSTSAAVVLQAERDANDAAALGGRHALGDQDVARLGVAGGAGRAGGDGVARAVEREHEQVGADARHQGEQMSRQPRRAGRDDASCGRRSAASSRARSAARSSAAARAAASAAANPTTPGTFSVPERRPCSWPPPHTSGGMRAGRARRPGSRRPWARRACAPRAPATRRPRPQADREAPPRPAPRRSGTARPARPPPRPAAPPAAPRR